MAIRTATLAAIDYASTHQRAIPTTEELAKHMGIAPKDSNFCVLPKGSLDDHMKRVKGDWPEVLVSEKHGGEDGMWAFGFVDGMCSIESPASYKERDNSGALQAISDATTKPSSDGQR